VDDFFGVISSGLGGEGATETEYVFVDLVGGSTFESAVRVGRLARLLLGGIDWDEAAEATGFLLLTRPCNERRNGLGIALADGTTLRLDPFAIAADPLGSVLRMFKEANEPS
jgi:hypothetical protein